MTRRNEIARLVTLKIDQTGTVQLDDQKHTLANLKLHLQDVASRERLPVEVQIQVDERCLAKHVLSVVGI